MRAQLFLIAMCSMCAGSVCAESAMPLVSIEYSADYAPYAEGTLPRQGSWLGLYCDGSDCEIRHAAVKISSSTAKNVVDEDEAIDVLDIGDSPFALFHGATLKPGKVVTWFKAESSPYDTSAYTQLQRLGRWQMPWGVTPLTISWVKLPEYGGFRYYISDGKAKQFLLAVDLEDHYGGDTAPHIYWVGDLDGDGKIDLLLTLHDGCSYDERLYLSSLATGQAFIKKAAQLSGTKAACGC